MDLLSLVLMNAHTVLQFDGCPKFGHPNFDGCPQFRLHDCQRSWLSTFWASVISTLATALS